MDIRKVVARNIRRYRVAQGLSQEALAVDAEIDRTHVSRIESGNENPTLLVLDRISRVLGVTICDFLEAPNAGEPAPKLLPKGRPRRK